MIKTTKILKLKLVWENIATNKSKDVIQDAENHSPNAPHVAGLDRLGGVGNNV